MFLASWLVSVFSVGLLAFLTKHRSNRVGKIHTFRRFAVSHYAVSFPNSIPPISTEKHGYCETIRQTDVVQQLVCMVSGGIKGDALSSRWRWVSEGRAGPAMRWDEGEEKHWLKQENSHYSSPVQGGHVPLGTDWLSSWSGSVSVINSTI